MDRPNATNNASLRRGHAWHVFPDPASPGAFDGDSPFNQGDTPGPGRPPLGPPPGVVDLWMLNKNTPGIVNDHAGHTYLVVTEKPEPPTVSSGWFVEAAHLSPHFELDQRGDRSARLVRIIHAESTRWGKLQDCEFQIDRG